MKQLSIEEKARRYDEAIKRVEDIKTGKCETRFMFTEGLFEHIFPALKESEDERIRKELLNAFQEAEDSLYMVLSPQRRKSFIAWLEKQGKNNMSISEATKQELEDNLNKALEKETPESCNEFLEKQGEQKTADNKDYSAPLDIEIPFGAKDSELIQETIRIPDGCYAFIEGNEIVIKKGEKPAKWSEEDEEEFQIAIDTLAEAGQHDSANWLKSLKDRVGCEANCTTTKEWSEEDNINCKRLLYFLDGGGLMQDHKIELFIWLKSLKDRYTWKPTDLQIEALESATENCAYSEYQDCLRELIGQLKKLREE